MDVGGADLMLVDLDDEGELVDEFSESDLEEDSSASGQVSS